MKFAKYLSLSLVLFTLFGCNNPPQARQIDNTVEASNNSQKENSTSKTIATNKENFTAPNAENSSSLKIARKETETETSNYPSKVVAQKEEEKIESGNIIGGRFDCNGDGISDGARIDYNGDGIPDDCIEEDEKAKTGTLIGPRFDCNGDGISDGARIDYNGDGIPDDCIGEDEIAEVIIDDTSYKTVGKSLEQLTQGCKETKKTQGYIDYTICKKGETLVSASEYAPEADAGLVYWFAPDGRLVAARYFSSGVLYIFDSNDKITSKFNVYESKKFDNISAEEIKQEEDKLLSSYQDILKVFNL